MVANTEKKLPIKMAGYLEKRGKMRVVCRWKRLWFVLKGRLLHYYKSQIEYVNLSPCRGSLNMGIAACVRPGKGLELQVLTRSQSIILRAATRLEQEQWLQALVDAMSLQDYHTGPPAKPVQHFRYSSSVTNTLESHSKFKNSKSLDQLSKISRSTKGDSEREDEDEDNNNGEVVTSETVSLMSKSTSLNRANSQVSGKSNCRCLYERGGSSKSSTLDSAVDCRFVLCNNCARPTQSVTCVSRSNTISSTGYHTDQTSPLQQFSLKHSKTTCSDTSIPNSLKNKIGRRNSVDRSIIKDIEDKCQSLKDLRSEIKDAEIKININQNIKKATRKPDYINRSESLNSFRYSRRHHVREMKLLIEGRTVYPSADTNKPTKNRRIKSQSKHDMEHRAGTQLKNSVLKKCALYEQTEVKSDMDISFKKQSDTMSGSFSNLSEIINSNCRDETSKEHVRILCDSPMQIKTSDEKVLSKQSVPYKDFHHLNGRQKSLSHDDINNVCSLNKTKTDSLLRRLVSKDREDFNTAAVKGNHTSHVRSTNSSLTLERKSTLKKRSLSFLKRVCKWKEARISTSENIDELNLKKESSIVERSSIIDAEDSTTSSTPTQDSVNQINANLDVEVIDETKDSLIKLINDDVPALPPRKTERSCSPSHDVPTNNKPIDSVITVEDVSSDTPPPLPKKTRRSTRSSSSELSGNSQVSSHQYVNCRILETSGENYASCDSNVIFEYQDKSTDYTQFSQPELVDIDLTIYKSIGEPVYDVPRLHATLRASLRSHHERPETALEDLSTDTSNKSPKKTSIDSFELFDSLDDHPVMWRPRSRYDSLIAPDSLEIEAPWSLESTLTPWNRNFQEARPSVTSESLPRNFISIDDRFYQDSLNT